MAYQLRADEILEALKRDEAPRYQEFKSLIEAATQGAAHYLAEQAGCKCGAGSFEGLAFAGLCVPFYPAHKGQELPDMIAGFDSEVEWEDE